ncbi:hypothetical protein ES707_18535 [subsurface metagenome]
MIEVEYEKGKEIVETCTCECGAALTLAWGGSWGIESYVLKCTRDINHSRIARPATLGPYDIPGFNLFNLKGRRKDMEQKYGPEKTRTLAKYIGTGAITKAIATEIVETLWGEAPPIEKTKAILLCQTYQLNPLMRHVYLVGYKRRDRSGNYIEDGQGNLVLDWSMQIGIGATRLLAQRKHNYSYLDLTPRKATQDEIDRILGDTADPNSIYGFCHIKDINSGAEAFGLRGIPKKERIKGEEKGNTHLNMACIRAERLALDRQYPGEMPQGVEVVDERFVEADYKVVEEKTDKTRGGGEVTPPIGGDEIGELGAEEKQSEEGEPVPTTSSSPVDKAQKIGAAAAGAEGFSIDPAWLNESLKAIKWTVDTTKTFLVSKYKISPQGTLADVIKRLTREQAEEFVKAIQQKLEQKQRELF